MNTKNGVKQLKAKKYMAYQKPYKSESFTISDHMTHTDSMSTKKTKTKRI